MPETPADYEQYLPVDEREDYFVNVEMPRSALRALERDARAYRRTQARDEGGDTPLEPGEAGLGEEIRRLSVGSPGDEMPPGDPYAEAQRIFDKEMADGRQWKQAFGAAFNSVVNAGNRGDQRVILRNNTPATTGGGG